MGGANARTHAQALFEFGSDADVHLLDELRVGEQSRPAPGPPGLKEGGAAPAEQRRYGREVEFHLPAEWASRLAPPEVRRVGGCMEGAGAVRARGRYGREVEFHLPAGWAGRLAPPEVRSRRRFFDGAHAGQGRRR